MLPFLSETEPDFEVGDYILVLGVKDAIINKTDVFNAYVIKENGEKKPLTLTVSNMTDDERQIILDGCIINYYRS